MNLQTRQSVTARGALAAGTCMAALIVAAVLAMGFPTRTSKPFPDVEAHVTALGWAITDGDATLATLMTGNETTAAALVHDLAGQDIVLVPGSVQQTGKDRYLARVAADGGTEVTLQLQRLDVGWDVRVS